MRTLFLLLALSVAATAQAAATVENVTPANTSVEINMSQTLSVRLRDAAANPSVGEAVTFSSEACGTFPNGLFQITVMSGAGGIASTTYTASGVAAQTCIVRVVAGAAARIDIITYRLDLVRINFDVIAVPNPPPPGRAFTIEAFVTEDVYTLSNVDFTIQVIAGTATAAISSTGGNTGNGSRLQINVFPDGIGDFEIEFDFHGVKRRFAVSPGAIAGTYTDLWWAGPAQNGWGMSVVQHGDRLFVVLYVYDANGRPTWYVLSGGTWNMAGTKYTGPLYAPRGSPFFAYDASRFVVGNPVGELSITFNDGSNAIIDYSIGTQVGTKQISRQPFGRVVANPMVNRGDMFWGGMSQNGWGVASLQQYDQLFIVWFTYDANGDPIWFVMPAGTWTGTTSVDGRLYRTMSSAWLGVTYNPAQLSVIDVGAFRLRFSGDTPIALDWNVDARSGTLTLFRQGF